MSDLVNIVIEYPIATTVIILFVLAFMIQLTIGICKAIYKAAPVVVPLMVIAAMLYLSNANVVPKETEVKDANHIESIEDQSGGSGYRE